jgi:predicted component of type VI protein secretion system
MLLALSVISDQGASLGPTAYKVFDERGGSIGRLNSNDWVLPDAQKLVSSRHANVRWASGVFYLEDASTNGTFVNSPDRRISKEAPARLQDGDRILIGDYQILVQLIDNSSSALQGGAANASDVGNPSVDVTRGAHTAPFGATSRTSTSGAWQTGSHTATSTNVGSQFGAMPQATPFSAPLVPPVTAQPPEPNVTLTGGTEDLLLLLGLDPDRTDPAIYAQIGRIMRIVVQGLIDVLNSRAEIKSQFRMPMTNIRPVENNPLKFSMNADDAFHNLFVKRNPGYLPPAESFREGFQDIAFHQMAMLAGVRAAFHSMLARFHPDHMEAVFEKKLRRASLFPFLNRLRYWGLYREQLEDIEKNLESHFQLMFGEEFAKAYSDQLQQLSAAARRGVR